MAAYNPKAVVQDSETLPVAYIFLTGKLLLSRVAHGVFPELYG
jgi:hypothetical protein